MAKFVVREEVLNVVLSQLLEERELLSVPETVRRMSGRRTHRMPDIVIADLWGVPIVVEGRIDSASARASLLQDARSRVEEGLSRMCLAVLYPRPLRQVDSMPKLRRAMASAVLRIRVVTEGHDGDWTGTSVDGIAEVLRRSYELLISDDVVTAAVIELDAAIEDASRTVAAVPTAPARLRRVLGIPEVDEGSAEIELASSRVASLTLVNAMIFQQVLAERHARVENLNRTAASPDAAAKFIEVWSFILDEIDYVPIFTTARELLEALIGNPGLDDALKRLAEAARRITSRRAALRHDLMGRIYHLLLRDAKYLGAFYTTIPAAALLLALTLEPEHWNVNWVDVDEVKRLRIADLACGTGTLLKSALQTVADNHVRASAAEGVHPRLREVFAALVEDVLWGFDVVPFAIHLAGSALALHDPDVKFGAMNLRTMPLISGPRPHLGSLDFIDRGPVEFQADLLGGVAAPTQVTGRGEQLAAVEVPDLDLCVMNPPFTRSVGGNLLFGSLPRRQRRLLRAELRRRVEGPSSGKRLEANITAGLGGVFAAMGHRYVKPGGHLALVVPRALLSGVAWAPTRSLLSREYHVRYIVVSHEPRGWNFSENTKLSECLVVARRLRRGQKPGPTKIVNLWRRPATSVEAVMAARAIKDSQGALLDGPGVEELNVGHKLGEIIEAPHAQMSSGDWGSTVAFSQTELCRFVHLAHEGHLYVPGRGPVAELPQTPLGSLGNLGPDRRDIHDGFNVTRSVTAFPVFWGHDTASVNTIRQVPNNFLSPLARARRRRPLRDATVLWSRSGRLLVVERLRLNTFHVTSVCLDQPVLSNTWWPFAVSDAVLAEAPEAEYILSLWLNSTFGILTLVGARVDTEGAWVQFKKPILARLLVLDPRQLTTTQRRRLSGTFEEVCGQELLRIDRILEDPVRLAIDDAIASVLGAEGELASIYQLILAEPLFQHHGGGDDELTTAMDEDAEDEGS